MPHKDLDAKRAYHRDYKRKRRVTERKEKAMNLETKGVVELANLKQIAIAAKDLDLLNAIDAEVWRRIYVVHPGRHTPTQEPVTWALGDDSEPMKVAGKKLHQ